VSTGVRTNNRGAHPAKPRQLPRTRSCLSLSSSSLVCNQSTLPHPARDHPQKMKQHAPASNFPPGTTACQQLATPATTAALQKRVPEPNAASVPSCTCQPTTHRPHLLPASNRPTHRDRAPANPQSPLQSPPDNTNRAKSRRPKRVNCRTTTRVVTLVSTHTENPPIRSLLRTENHTIDPTPFHTRGSQLEIEPIEQQTEYRST
jgi:hypothetical protein